MQEGFEDIEHSCCAYIDCKQPLKPYDPVVDVECTNPECPHPTIMHSECFQTFETNLIAGLAQQARYKQASQRVLQNDLWGENAYTLVYKLCTCECTKGVIRLRKAKKMDQLSRTRTETGDSQDTGYSSSPSNYNNVSPTEGARHVNGKSNGKMKAGLGTMKEFIDTEVDVILKNMKVKRKGKRSILSIGTIVNDAVTDKHPGEVTEKDLGLYSMRQTNFQHRLDFDELKAVLPPGKMNSSHIKCEGDGYGSDDRRNYILSNLSLCRADTLPCAICHDTMTVYDQFPLVDGLLFLSPDINNPDHPVFVKVDGKPKYIHAVCVQCLEGDDVECEYCFATWHGGDYQLGTLYNFDVFAAKPCCPERVACKNCRNPLGDYRIPRPYSYYSRRERCNVCFTTDFHCINPLNSYRLKQDPTRFEK